MVLELQAGGQRLPQFGKQRLDAVDDVERRSGPRLQDRHQDGILRPVHADHVYLRRSAEMRDATSRRNTVAPLTTRMASFSSSRRVGEPLRLTTYSKSPTFSVPTGVTQCSAARSRRPRPAPTIRRPRQLVLIDIHLHLENLAAIWRNCRASDLRELCGIRCPEVEAAPATDRRSTAPTGRPDRSRR